MYVHPQAITGARVPPEPGWLRLDHATIADRQHLADAPRATHVHAVYHLVLYTRGHGSFLLHDQVVPYVAPYVVLTAPGHPHSFQGTPDEDGVYSELTFQGRDRQGRTLLQGWPELMASRFRHPCPLPAHGPLTQALARELAGIMERIVELGLSGIATADALIHAHLEQALFVLFRHHLREGPPEGIDAIDQARQLLESAADEPQDVAMVARTIGLSAKHLARAFKQRFGLPPVQYRRHWSMQQAATLIRSSQLALQDIAGRLGFHDPAYFSRVFRSVHGMSPQHYRLTQQAAIRQRDP